MGTHERHIDGKLVGLGAPTGLKKGGHDCDTYLYPLSRSVPPGFCWSTQSIINTWCNTNNVLSTLTAWHLFVLTRWHLIVLQRCFWPNFNIKISKTIGLLIDINYGTTQRHMLLCSIWMQKLVLVLLFWLSKKGIYLYIFIQEQCCSFFSSGHRYI